MNNELSQDAQDAFDCFMWRNVTFCRGDKDEEYEVSGVVMSVGYDRCGVYLDVILDCPDEKAILDKNNAMVNVADLSLKLTDSLLH